MKLLLKPDGVVRVELPHLRSLVDGNQLDAIYHDCFSFFSFTSLHQIFRRQASKFSTSKRFRRMAAHCAFARDLESTALTVSPRVRQMLTTEEQLGMKSLAYYADFAQRVRDTKHNLLERLLHERRRQIPRRSHRSLQPSGPT